jgi:hypothetical protein
LKSLVQTFLHKIILVYDNFDYNQGVRHQTLRDPAKHICATTGKLCIGQHIPDSGLLSSMFHPETLLTVDDVYLAPGNDAKDINQECQRFWIAEAIRYIHRDAVESIFSTSQSSTESVTYPKFPSVERLAPRKTPHFGLTPILENEGTIQGTYEVINKIFIEQLGLDPATHFKNRLYPLYGDQKTVSLIQTVKRERKYCENVYGQFQWLLPVPGLFHWRTNFIDMIYNVYGGSESSNASIETTLLHNQLYMGYTQGHNSPFHHKEEVATRAFDARIAAMFYSRIREKCSDINDRKSVDRYIAKLGPSTFLDHVEAIRNEIFARESQGPVESESEDESAVDHKFVAHCRFLCQMETYKSLKYAIKHADIGIIERVFARCCLLFHGSKKKRYAFLSLYMTWLTHTRATTPELRKALLANGLVNLRGAEDGWFEMDRLNEFFNLQMKTIMVARRSSTQQIHDLFRRLAMTAGYCSNLNSELEASFGEYSNRRHQVKDASEDVYRLAYELFKIRSVVKFAQGRDSAFKPADIMNRAVGDILFNSIEKFNASQFGDEDFEDAPTESIAELDDILDEFSDGSVA